MKPVATAEASLPPARKPPRLWPGIAAAAIVLVVRYGLPLALADGTVYGMLGGIAVTAVILVWWLFFSRLPWSDRFGALIIAAAAVWVARQFVDASISNGMMGNMLVVFSIPPIGVALVVWAVTSHRLSRGPRYASLAGILLVTCGIFTLLRTGGVSGDGVSDLHWRWTPSPEQLLLSRIHDEPAPLPAASKTAETPVSPPSPPPAASNPPAAAPAATTPMPAPTTPAAHAERPVAGSPAAAPSPAPAGAPTRLVNETRANWPGFRGPNRDGVARGVKIDTDWTKSPPVQLWRRAIGPGWSSFAVRGDVLYTQEQRGDDEVVAAYKVSTGEPVWRHRDAVRFWESNGGAGPRGTPTLHDGRVYTFGATGIVNALEMRDGSLVWSRNAGTDTQVDVPEWGFSSSPLVVDDEVVVAASGRLIAYDIATGKPRWLGPSQGGGYSSPHLLTIDGVPQILLARGRRTTSVAPADGSVLWEHSGQPAVSIVQPALTANGDILVAAGDAMGGIGTRRIAIAHGSSGWTVEDRWISRGLKPYFNDFVVHKGYAYGFDGNILSCIDLEDGARKWKGGRFGNGQLVLLADQDVLLVLSEDGDLALVGATPDQFKELGRFTALDGKTWNHPVLVGDTLLVRNGQEMAAFRLSLAR